MQFTGSCVKSVAILQTMLAWAKDRALLWSTPSADPGAKIREGLRAMHRLMGSLPHTSVPLRLFWRFASKSKRCFILTSSVALLCCAHIAFESGTLIAAEPDKGLKQQLLSAAPDAWGRWKEWAVHTEAEFSEEELRHSSPGKPVSVVDLQYYLKGMTRRRHFFKTLPDGRRYEEIAIRRDEYFFTAERYASQARMTVDLSLRRFVRAQQPKRSQLFRR